MADALKPCPFCGPGNSVVEYYQDPYDYHIVGCGRCGSHSGTRPKSDPDGKAKVIASWNSRPVEAISLATLCAYQLKFWTLSYQNTKFFGALLRDDEDWEDE